MRTAELSRKTRETDVKVRLNLDGTGIVKISTGIGFFDHMLTALGVHAGFDLEIQVEGDLQVDCHHTIEDTGIVLGQAVAKALGDAPVARYGSAFVPWMRHWDLWLLISASGRFWCLTVHFLPTVSGNGYPNVEEFFRAFAYQAGITLHARLEYGKNDHHKAEALFKALAHSLKAAVAPLAGRRFYLPKVYCKGEAG